MLLRVDIGTEGVSFFWFHFLTYESYDRLDEEALVKELAKLKNPDLILAASAYRNVKLLYPAGRALYFDLIADRALQSDDQPLSDLSG